MSNKPNPFDLAARLPVILFAGWLIPGMSHYMIGQRKKGLFLCVLLLATFMVGQHLGAYRIVDWERHPMSFVGQSGIALPWGAGYFVTQKLGPEVEEPPHEVLGLLYSAVASILNLLCVLDAYERVVRMNLPKNEPVDEKKAKKDAKEKTA